MRVLHRADVSSLPEHDQEREDAAILDRFLRRRFYIDGGEVMRVLLTRWSPARHRLTISFHHAVSDPQSLEIFNHELTGLWRAFVLDPQAAASVLPPTTATALDLVDYLERLDSSPIGERQRAYWRTQLAGASPIVLPTDLPREPVDARRAANDGFVTFPSATVVERLDAADTAALGQIARASNASILSVLLAMMSARLSAETGQDDLAIVSHLLFRHIPGLERSLGFFSNALVLRVSTAGAPTFSELVQRTHATVTNAFDHGEFDVLRQASNLFRVFFNYHYTPSVLRGETEAELPPGVIGRPAPYAERENAEHAYDLLLFVDAFPDRVLFHLSYNVELYREPTAAKFLQRYVEAMRKACADETNQAGRGPR